MLEFSSEITSTSSIGWWDELATVKGNIKKMKKARMCLIANWFG